MIDRSTDHEKTLSADLVVDATGRGSRTPVFLEQFGYPRPPEDEVKVQLAYASQLVRIPPGIINEHMIAHFPQAGRPRMFAMIGYENNFWMIAGGTIAGLEPPREYAEIVS